MKANKMHDYLIREACLGFSGPEDQVFSLNVPLAKEDRQNSPYHCFDVEYDSEQSDKVTIRLLGLDQGGFIRTVLQSAPFPVDMLADLIRRRKATTEEVEEWKTITD
jgi:hypothetical protein